MSVFKNRGGETTAQDLINHETGNGVPNLQGSLKKESEVAQSCPILCDPMDCSLPDSSVHGMLQGKILEWVAISFSKALYISAIVKCVPFALALPLTLFFAFFSLPLG